eukprot:SAG11_NODE_25476_length_358_cov_0.965251_1_plen_33_part_01
MDEGRSYQALGRSAEPPGFPLHLPLPRRLGPAS